MPQYLLSVHGVDSDYDPDAGKFGAYGSEEEAESAFAATGVFNEKLTAEGYFVFAGGLRSASTATVVDGTGDKPVYTDGPYLESKEYLGGFWVIEAPDLDVALRLAAEGSMACSRQGRGAPVPGRDRAGMIEQVFRDEWSRVVASLARRFGDLDIAEEAAGEAFAAAVATWGSAGTTGPPNPGGWLMTTATRKATDRIRREYKRETKRRASTAAAARPSAGPRRRGRSAPADLHLRSPRTRARGTTGAHAAAGRRAHGGSDRPRLAVQRGGDRAANPPAPRPRSERLTSRSSFPSGSPNASTTSSPSSTSSSTRATSPAATPSYASTSPTKPSDWPGCCTTWCRTNPRRPACSRCCCSPTPAVPPASTRPVSW